MMFFISGELIALLTFPGVILHEIAHRFMCDIQRIPVYLIKYFSVGSTVAGHVLHQPTSSCRKSFFVSVAPLIINSFVCMILTLPYGIAFYLGTTFMFDELDLVMNITAWVGFSAGLHAIPSQEDMKNLPPSSSGVLDFAIFVVNVLVGLSNIPYIGFFAQCAYACGLSMVIPMIFL